MSDSATKPRHVGDATRRKIDGLADGWSRDSGGGGQATEHPRSKATSMPPMPPMPPPPPPPPPGAKVRAKGATVPPPTPPSVEPPASFGPPDTEIPTVTRDAPTHMEPPASFGPQDTQAPTIARDAPAEGDSPHPRLRMPAVMRRRRGLLGDVRYVLTVATGVAEARRELRETEAHLSDANGRLRERHIAVARKSLSEQRFTLPDVATARTDIARIGDRRAELAGVVTATETDIDAASDSRTAKLATHQQRISEVHTTLRESRERLPALERDATVVTKRAANLKGEMGVVERQLADAREAADSPGTIEAARARAEATMAGLAVERDALIVKERPLAQEQARVNEPVATCEAAISAAEDEIQSLEDAVNEENLRYAEIVAALEARKVVEARAVRDTVAQEDRLLAALGDFLGRARPDFLGTQLRLLDTEESAIADLEQRIIELRERVAGVDRAKFARGMGLIAAAMVVAGLLVAIIA